MNVRIGTPAMLTLAEEGLEGTSAPPGSVAVAVAVLVNVPSGLVSAAVRVWVPVQTIEAPAVPAAPRVVRGQVTGATCGSVTAAFVNGWAPELVSRNW